jgi:hypothetical protein
VNPNHEARRRIRGIFEVSLAARRALVRQYDSFEEFVAALPMALAYGALADCLGRCPARLCSELEALDSGDLPTTRWRTPRMRIRASWSERVSDGRAARMTGPTVPPIEGGVSRALERPAMGPRLQAHSPEW